MAELEVDWNKVTTEEYLEKMLEDIPELKGRISVKEILDLCRSKERAFAYLLNLKLQPHAEVYYRSGQIVIRAPSKRRISTYNTELELIMKRFLEDLRLTNYEFQYEVKGYILDFAFPDLKLAIEVGHVRWHPEERDKKKEKALSDWKILWFNVNSPNVNSPEELKEREEEIKRTIKEEIKERTRMLRQ